MSYVLKEEYKLNQVKKRKEILGRENMRKIKY